MPSSSEALLMTDKNMHKQAAMKNQRWPDKFAMRSFLWGFMVGMVASPRHLFVWDYHLPAVATESFLPVAFHSLSSSKMSRSSDSSSSSLASTIPGAVSTLSSSTKSSNMWQTLAPSFFPIHPETGQIILPDTVKTIVLDVGARRSDYLSALEATMDDTVALFLFDPQPDSYIPLTQRTAAYAMDNNKVFGFNLHPTRSRQVFVVPVALGPTETQMTFQITHGPACGSLLPNNEKAGFLCNNVRDTIQANVVTLKSFLDLLPRRNNLTVHLKVDAEGYDLEVLRGAGTAIQEFETIIIECQNLNATDNNQLLREGGCRVDEAVPFLEQHGFATTWKAEGQQGNLYARNNIMTTAATTTIPAFLADSKIRFREWYLSVNDRTA